MKGPTEGQAVTFVFGGFKMTSFGRYSKLIAFMVGAALTVAVHVWGSSNTWVLAATLVAAGIGVYRAPANDPPAVPK